MQDKNSVNNRYKQEEFQLSQQTATFLNILTDRGIIGSNQLDEEKIKQVAKSKKRKKYHNTLMLLQNYRSIVWVLQCLPAQIAEELDKPMEDLDALLSLINAELGMDNTRNENRLRSVEKSRLLLDRFNEALTILKQKPGNGAKLYDIIYMNYIGSEELTPTEIFNRLEISGRHFYRLREQAINILSIRLWSAPTAEFESWVEVLALFEEL